MQHTISIDDNLSKYECRTPTNLGVIKQEPISQFKPLAPKMQEIELSSEESMKSITCPSITTARDMSEQIIRPLNKRLSQLHKQGTTRSVLEKPTVKITQDTFHSRHQPEQSKASVMVSSNFDQNQLMNLQLNLIKNQQQLLENMMINNNQEILQIKKMMSQLTSTF